MSLVTYRCLYSRQYTAQRNHPCSGFDEFKYKNFYEFKINLANLAK